MKKSIFLLIVLGGILCFINLTSAQNAEEKPRCNSDQDCQRPGMRGFCQNPGQKTASCIFEEVVKVYSMAIVPQGCRTCHVEEVVNELKTIFPGLIVEYLDVTDPRAVKLIKDMKIEMLPAYILSKQVEKDVNFLRFRQIADLINDQYYVKPSFAGVSYFVNRKADPGRLDLFLVLTQENALSVLRLAKELIDEKKDKIRFQLNFVGAHDPETGELLSPGGKREINEEKMYACVEQGYPQKTWDYLFCRTGSIDSLWWEDCLVKNDIDASKIKECVNNNNTDKLLKEKNQLSDGLKISYSPVFLLDNIEIFSITDKTNVGEIVRLIESKKDNPKGKKEKK